MTNDEVSEGLQRTIGQYGEYTYDIPLPYGIWTRGNEGVPHTRLKRILQAASDLAGKPIEASRVLDLGCLDGQFSIEFALQGAEVTGVEIRKANVQRAEFAKKALALTNLEFVQEDVRKISRKQYGAFDIIICSGILYHLTTPDVFEFTEQLYDMCDRMVIVDTHISLEASIQAVYKGKNYSGCSYFEHFETDTQEVKETRTLSSIDNDTSFWFTRPSLVNLLQDVGFSSVHECFVPSRLDDTDRCTFVAIKQPRANLITSPAANEAHDDYAEGSLSYCPPLKAEVTVEGPAQTGASARELALERELAAMRASWSWRLTAPLRDCLRRVRR